MTDNPTPDARASTDSPTPDSPTPDETTTEQAAAERTVAGGAPPPRKRRVSVVYFHGMGEQRRFEEVSQLIDSLDKYSGNERRLRQRDTGGLAKIRPRIEESRLGDDRADVSYISAKFFPPNGERGANCKFYEVYWAPLMAPSPSMVSVLIWLFSTLLRPIQTMRCVWRERQRLRRASLFQLREQPDARHPISDGDFYDLVSAYDRFAGSTATRSFPRGRFREFQAFLRQRFGGDEPKLQRLLTASKRWKRTYLTTEIKNLFFLLTIALALLSTAFLSLALVVQLLDLVEGVGFVDWLKTQGLDEMAESITPSFANAAPLLIALLTLLGLSRFVTHYLGDVMHWTTYSETEEQYDKRARVLRLGLDTLHHVLNDPDCDEVIVVAHSLGTTVAHDVLLTATRYNMARNRENPIASPILLEKIKCFVTIASPIDKVHYLFESARSRSRRYLRVIDELRGDLGTAPFAKNRKPHVHWINFWDVGDIISGPLHSPSNRQHALLSVDNVHTSNLYFPDPAASHSAYFQDRTTISTLFDIIFRGKHQYVSSLTTQPPNTRLGPGKQFLTQSWLLAAVILIPWLLTTEIGIRLFGWQGWIRTVADWSMLALLGLVAAAFIIGKLRGPRNPL